MDKLLLRPVEVAAALSISRSRAYELLASGQIPGVVRLGRSIRVSARCLAAFVEQLEKEAGAVTPASQEESNHVRTGTPS